MEMASIHRPVPRRAFEITPASSSESSRPSSPPPESQNPDLLMSQQRSRSPAPSRTRSILNLTSSTLLGIYSGATDGGGRGEELNTPWGTGAQTPNHYSPRPSLDAAKLQDRLQDKLQVPSFPFNDGLSKRPVVQKTARKTFKNHYFPLLSQTVMLFGFGMGFGSLITHVHKTQHINPMPVPTSSANSRYYQIAWGILGVVLGNLLPQIDVLFDDEDAIADGYEDTLNPYQKKVRSLSRNSQSGRDRPSLVDSGMGPIWYSAVRSAGAFAGIAFALRKVPWQSTLQVSLTLAVANPVLWYLIDRSKPGLALSLLVSVGGTILSFIFDPSFVPMPGIYQEQASEKVGVFLWLASILFCTSLCFGAIGRRLQL